MKIYAMILLALSLSACSQLPVNSSLPAAPTSLTAQNSPRLFETFQGYLLRSSYDSLKLAEMGMTVRSLLGKTYDNRNSASRYHLYYSGQTSGLAQAHGPVRFGRDGVLYLEHLTLAQGQTQRLYYRLGTYSPLPNAAAENQPITYQLDKGVSLKMDWRGINPMDHDRIQWTVPTQLRAVTKQPSDLLN